jgi:hypothetical protein
MSMINLPGLRRQEHEAASELNYAFDNAQNRQSVSQGDRNFVSHTAAESLNAANPWAKIVWGNCLWDAFLRHHGVCSAKQLSVSLYWITLVDIACITTLTANPVKLRSLKQRLCSGLRGLSYIGAVDLAYYVYIAPGTDFHSLSGVSWHLHLIAWGEPLEVLRLRFAAMNQRANNYRSIIPGGTGAHWMSLSNTMLSEKFCYMVRTPHKAYSVGARRKPLQANRYSAFKHNSRAIRPGERIALFHLLKCKSLPEMTVAGGEGVQIRRAALRHAD